MFEIMTKDADEAAFRWVQEGAELVQIMTKNGYRKKVVWFGFTLPISEEQYNVLMSDYQNGKTLVEPKAFMARRCEVKNIIKQRVFRANGSDGQQIYGYDGGVN